MDNPSYTPEQLENYERNMSLIAAVRNNFYKLTPIMQLIAGVGTQDLLMVDLYNQYPASSMWVQFAKK